MFATAQTADPELKQLRQWTDKTRTFLADELAPLSGRLKCFAQLLIETLLYNAVIVLRRADDPERKIIVVPSAIVERVICFSRKTWKSPSICQSNLGQTYPELCWLDLKRDV